LNEQSQAASAHQRDHKVSPAEAKWARTDKNFKFQPSSTVNSGTSTRKFTVKNRLRAAVNFGLGARSPGLVQGRRDSDLEALKGFMRWSGSASSSITTPGKPSKPWCMTSARPFRPWRPNLLPR